MNMLRQTGRESKKLRIEFSGLFPVKRLTRMGLDGNVNAIYLAFHVNSGIIEASAVLDQMLIFRRQPV